MSRTVIVALTLLVVALGGCAREFDAPPPETTVHSFGPRSGFADDLVVICGRNLGAGDSATTVRFGTVLAEEADDEEGLVPDCPYERLAVQVPELADPGEVDLVVSSATGQATAAEAFEYLGPGHPPEDVLSGVVRIRSRPYSLAARRIEVGQEVTDVMVAACYDSSLIQLIESSEAVSFGFGTDDQPISAEVTLDGVDFSNGKLTVDFSVLACLVAVDQQGALDMAPRLVRKAAQFVVFANNKERLSLQPSQDVLLPQPPANLDGAGYPIWPWRLWSHPRPADPDVLDVVVSHAAAPVLWMLPGGDEGQAFAVGAPAPAPGTPVGCDYNSWTIDLALVHGGDQLTAYAIFATDIGHMGADLWMMDMLPGAVAERVGPADPVTGDARCDGTFSSLATRRLDEGDHDLLRVYAADFENDLVVEYAWWTTLAGERLVWTGRAVQLPAAVFDMATGRYTRADGTASEHLYAATSAGIYVIDISDPIAGWDPLGVPTPLEVVDRLDLGPDVAATTLSFSVIDAFDPAGPDGADRVFFANMAADRWHAFEAGQEQLNSTSQPIVTSLPEVAPSSLLDGFYLADATVDVLRVVERRSGVQCMQVPIEGKAGFSQGIMASAYGQDRDVVLVALPDPTGKTHELGFPEFDRIVGISFEPGSGDACSLQASASGAVDVPPFHQMLVLREGDYYVLKFFYYGELPDLTNPELPVEPGYARRCQLDLNLPAAQMMAQVECVDDPLPEGLLYMRLSPRYQAAAYLFLDQGLGVFQVQDLLDDAIGEMNYYPTDQAMGFFMDMLAVRLGSPSEPAYLLAIALGSLGQVQLAYFGPDGAGGHELHERLLQIGGNPELVFTSPDERKLYFVHPSEDLVSVVDLDCEDLPNCIQVEQTLSVDELPYGVAFSETGEVGYVSHLFGSVLSVIE